MHWAGRSLPLVETTKEDRTQPLACRNLSSCEKICEKHSGDYMRRLFKILLSTNLNIIELLTIIQVRTG